MMIFLYGVVNRLSGEPPAQARVPAETEPEALQLVRKCFDGVLRDTENGEEALGFTLLDVQDVTEPDVELSQIIIKTPNGDVWSRDL